MIRGRAALMRWLAAVPAGLTAGGLALLGLLAIEAPAWLGPALPEGERPRWAVGLGLLMIGLYTFSAGFARRAGLRPRASLWLWTIETCTLILGLFAVLAGSNR